MGTALRVRSIADKHAAYGCTVGLVVSGGYGKIVGHACALPQCEGNRNRIYINLVPPCGLVTMTVNLSVMGTANWDCEFVAYFAAEGIRLRETEMVGIRGLSPTDEARLRGDEFTVGLVAIAARFRQGQATLVDSTGPTGVGAL